MLLDDGDQIKKRFSNLKIENFDQFGWDCFVCSQCVWEARDKHRLLGIKGDEFKLSIPSKWNPRKEVEYPGQVLRYEDNLDANGNVTVMVTPNDKNSITDFGSPKDSSLR